MNDDAGAIRANVVRRVSWIGIIGNGCLALMKVVTGIFTGSLAVLADGFDSTADIFTSAVSLFASKIMRKPPDKDHPYGHGRVESLATKIISFVIIFVGIELGTQAVQRLISGEFASLSWIAVIVTGVSICGKIFLAVVKISAGRRIKSLLLISDGKNMRNDVVLSIGVLLGLLAGELTGWWWIDCVVALIISLWIIYVGFSLFRESDKELMEGHDDLSDYQTLFDAVATVSGAKHPHKVRIRRIANMLIIDLDIEVLVSLSVGEGHDIAVEVERVIKARLENVYDVQVHVEPYGNREDGERYGITVEELNR